jgi:antitoxin ParD1/3/4
MTLHVSLPQELEKLVHQEVKSGMYGSASEVVREALRGFFGSMAGRQMRDIAELRPEVQDTIRRIDAGEEELFDGEAAFAQLAEKHGLRA